MSTAQDLYFRNIGAAVALRAATNVAKAELDSASEVEEGNLFTSITSRQGFKVVITITKE